MGLEQRISFYDKPTQPFVLGITPVEKYSNIRRQSHRIEVLDVNQREHAARPYPSGGRFDFLAIDVPSTYQQGKIPDGEEPPHGMLRVIAAARGFGETPAINAGIYDAHRLKHTPSEIERQLQILNPRLVGLNPTSVNVPEAQAIAQICDRLQIPYILGGIHATLDPRVAMEDFPGASAFVRGNGEVVITPLVRSLLNKTQAAIMGVYYHSMRPSDDDYPHAAKLNPGNIPMVDQNLLVEAPVYTHEITINGKSKTIKEATLHVTEGCPFGCFFCSSPVMVARGKKDENGHPIKPYTRPPMERIIDEIEHCVGVGGLKADSIHFLDDMAFVTAEHVNDLHAGLVRRGLMGQFIWRGLTRAPVIEKFDEDIMKKMLETGVWKIAMGVESGNDEILRRMQKQVTTKQVIEATEKLARYGIQMKGFFIMGFPGETRAQIEDTVNLMRTLKTIGMTEVAAFQFKPYPGTEFYEEIKRDNPDILENLTYLRRSNSGLTGKAEFRVEEHDTWLPPDLKIAAIPSGEVQQYVEGAIAEFYDSASVKATSECI